MEKLTVARIKIFHPSTMVNQLIGLGILLLAIEIANRSLPLAGRLQHFIENWEKITHNSWVLGAVQDYSALLSTVLPTLPCRA